MNTEDDKCCLRDRPVAALMRQALLNIKSGFGLALQPVDKPHSPTYYFPIMANDRRRRRIERLLDQAEEAVARIDFQEVRDRPQAVLAFEPDNGDALDLLTAPQGHFVQR